MDAQKIIASIVFGVTVFCNSVCLLLLYKRRNKQPVKSRSPIWLAVSLIIGEIQISIHLWNIMGLAECHFVRISLHIAYSGYLMCLIVRCWKLHFAFNINKSKLFKENYKTWFHKKKYFVSDRFLLPVFLMMCIWLFLLGFLFDATDNDPSWESQFPPCDLPWFPDLFVNATLFSICVTTLIVFCVLLHHIDDGFQISLELQVSIATIFVFYSICIVLAFAGGQLFESGKVKVVWFMVIPQPVSAIIAVYLPIYQSYTFTWYEKDSILNVPRKELEDMQHFLCSPSGFGPFMRFLHTEFSAELFFLWRDIEEYSKQEDEDERKLKAEYIKDEYLHPEGSKYMVDTEYFYEQIRSFITDCFFATNIFDELKAEVEKRLHSKFSRFMLSKFYSQYACGVTISESLVSMGLQ